MSSVRNLRPDEVDEAAELLSEAFGGGDFYRNFICKGDNLPDEKVNELHELQFRYIIWAHMINGLALVPSENLDAIALWLPPGRNPDDWIILFRSGLWRMFYKFGRNGRRNYFTRFMGTLRRAKARTMGDRADKCWYLTFLATRPEARGRGHARQLIRHVTDIADNNDLDCYLEASGPSTSVIYEKYGFKTLGDIPIPTSDPPIVLIAMGRPPQSTSEGSL